MALTTLLAWLTLAVTATAARSASTGCKAVCVSEALENLNTELEALKRSVKGFDREVKSNSNYMHLVWSLLAGPPKEFDCQPDRSSCYLFVEEKVGWFPAQQHCRRYGAHLAVVEDWEENEYLRREIKKRNWGNQGWWIGLTDEDHESSFDWVTNKGKKKMQFEDWDHGQPDNSGHKENYVEIWMNGRGWNDRPATFKDMFICEFEKKD